jgi:hypothetical protein
VDRPRGETSHQSPHFGWETRQYPVSGGFTTLLVFIRRGWTPERDSRRNERREIKWASRRPPHQNGAERHHVLRLQAPAVPFSLFSSFSHLVPTIEVEMHLERGTETSIFVLRPAAFRLLSLISWPPAKLSRELAPCRGNQRHVFPVNFGTLQYLSSPVVFSSQLSRLTIS